MPFDQDKAVNELQAELDKIDFSGGMEPVPSTPETPVAEPADAPVSPTPESEDVAPTEVKDELPVEETPTDKPAEDKESTPESPTEEPAEDDTIPDSHYRAARHIFTIEDIAEFYEANPKVAKKLLAKCYEIENATSEQLGKLGQQARQLQERIVAPQTQPVDRKAELLKQLKEKYEDDPIIDVLGELIPDQVATPVPQPEPIQHPQQPSVDQIVSMRQQINNFFGADEMEAYDDLYGTTSQTGDWTETLTPGQRANRRAVCDEAQLILIGAEASGMQMSIAEALERAHLRISAPMAETVVRERIAKSVQKRAKSVTLKPSGLKPAPSADAYDKKRAVQEMDAELKAVFGK